jgi:hypothetical protein
VRPAVESLEQRRVPAVHFALPQTFATGFAPVYVVVGDFNSDGRPDLAVANDDMGTVSVLPGNGDGTFRAPEAFGVGASVWSLAVGDINGDGEPDLIVIYPFDNKLGVLLSTTPAGSTTVSFAALQTFGVGAGDHAVAVGDFNSDGRPDLVTSNSGDGTVSVLLNTTPKGATVASFAAQQTFAVGPPSAVAVADVNGDGKPDLAVANPDTNTVTVLLNTTAAGASTASFAAPRTFAAGPRPAALVAGDFNGDNHPDLAVANPDTSAVAVLLNTTPKGASVASFAAPQTFAVSRLEFDRGDAHPLAVADFDGDGRPDLAVTTYVPNGSVFIDGTVSVLLNTTPAGSVTTSFAAPKVFERGTRTASVATGDFDGDGRPDLAFDNGVGFEGTDVAVLLNTAPAVVGQFGGQGVWEFDDARGTWVQLTAANASLLGTDSYGDVVGAFPGHGVWEFRPASGWAQINGIDATALAVDPAGDVAATFPGFGVGEYRPGSGWSLLTGANAALLALAPSGAVAGAFPGYGVWEFLPDSGWEQINGQDASLLAMDLSGDVAANFPGVGVAEYTWGRGWQLLNGQPASSLAVNASGGLAAQFPGVGVGEYLPASGWLLLTAADAYRLGVQADGTVFGAFPGSGVWEFDPDRGWFQLTAADATLLATA